jgi:hypothetical protein
MSLPPLLSAQSAVAVSDTPMFVSDLGLWLKADAGVTLVGGAVDAWADQSGNGRNFSAPAEANRPAYSGTLNGLPVLTFDGSTDYLQGNAASLNLARNVPGLTAIAVFSHTVATAFRLLSLSTTASTVVRYLAGGNGTGYILSGRRLDSDSAVLISGGTQKTVPVVSTFIARYSEATAAIFEDGASQVDTPFLTAGSTSDTDSNRLAIGSALTLGSTLIQGDIAELIVYRRAITQDERATVENYLRAKWGI